MFWDGGNVLFLDLSVVYMTVFVKRIDLNDMYAFFFLPVCDEL